MISRLTLGVALTAALVGVTAPALAAVQADAADSAMDRQLSALADRLQRMVATDGPGARRVATLRLPARSLTSAGVRDLRFGTRAGVGVARWTVGETNAHSRRLVGVPLRAGENGVRLAEPGPHRLAFELRRADGQPVVAVSRRSAAGDPTGGP